MGRGKVTCDNVEAVGGIQDLLQADHVWVLCQHAHDPHLLHDHDIVYDMLVHFLYSSSVAYVGWRYTAHA